MLLRKQENSSNCLVSFAVALAASLLLSTLSAVAQVGKADKSPSLATAKDRASAAPVKDMTKDKGKDQGKFYKGTVIKQTSINQGAMTIYLCPHRWALRTGLINIIADEEKDIVIAYT